MNRIPSFSMLLLLVFASFVVNAQDSRLLIFYKTAGFHHGCIAVGVPALYKLGVDNGFAVDTSTDVQLFNSKNLSRYKAIIFMNTTGTLFNEAQQKALVRYMKKGGGYVGIHAASDTEFDWPWYNGLAGAYFMDHPRPQQATLHITDTTHISTKHLPKSWIRTDEWYNFRNIQPGLNVLITIDENSYQGGKNSPLHPMAWYRSYGGGRSFYTELGHTDESYSDPLFLKHVLGGILYAAGKNMKM